MPSVGRPGRRRACLVLTALAVAVSVFAGRGRLHASAESAVTVDSDLRALLVEHGSLGSPASIAAAVNAAQSLRFNTLTVEARSLGELYFNNGLGPRAAALGAQPASFDPLAVTLALAHGRGIKVHARVSVSLAASAADMPISRGHLVNAHPEWLMVPRALARELTLLDAGSQLFLDRLLRWTRAQPDSVGGIYASPVPDEAADAVVALVADLAARYPIDGIHLDDVAYPTTEFDYSRAALEAFKADVLAGLDAQARREREREIGADLTAWPDALPDRWRDFRRDRLTALVGRLRRVVRLRRPEAVVSAAVVPDAGTAGLRHLQDWAGWSERHLVDAVCPIARTIDAATFASQVADAGKAAGDTPVWVEIGAFRLSVTETADRIRTAQRLGARGVVIDSYDNLMSQPDGVDYLARLARAVFDP
jgi:uncharacterized lipoprotein YddW (UPF0748 family)